MRRESLVWKVISACAAMALVFGLMPASALALNDDRNGSGGVMASTSRTDEDIDAAISKMLASGDYVEGEAIVCSMEDSLSAGGLSTQSTDSNDLLASAEQLSTVTADQYEDATGESVPTVDTPKGALRAQSTGDEGAVTIALVRKDGIRTEQLLRALLADPRVLSAEPNYIGHFASDDTDAQSGHANGGPALTTADVDGLTAQASGETTVGFTDYEWHTQGVAEATPQYLRNADNPGIHPPDWNDSTKENAGGVIVIMDTGVDYTHPDLKNVMYHFTPELQQQLGCGEFGYATSRENKTDPMDYFEHGTHCAGIAAAQWNGFGMSGVANGTQICAISIAQSETMRNFSYDGIIKGYDFMVRAAKAGVDIRAVNRSFFDNPTNNAAAAMIQAAGDAGIVSCLASGNDHKDLDIIADDNAMVQYSPYVLRVNASRQQDDRAWFSCFGHYTTDVFAPGAGILSTVPTGVTSTWRYFPQADNEKLYEETAFDGTLPRVGTYDFANQDSSNRQEPPIVYSDVSQAQDFGFDGDMKSAKLTARLPMGEPSSILIDVPVNSLDDADVQDVALALYFDEVDLTSVSLSIMLEDGTYLNMGQDGSNNRSDNNLYGWALGDLHIPDSPALNKGFMRIEHEDTQYIRLRFNAQFNDSTYTRSGVKSVQMYLDRIAIGRKGNTGLLPYRYMNGTSMATPVATGSVAVVSETVKGATPSERAAETVRILKGAVHQTPGYHGLCKQGGQIDLGILGQEDAYVPVIDSAEVSGNTITIGGAYFGASEGTLTVGGVQSRQNSWSASKITAPWPSGIQSGLVPVVVKSNAGEGCRAFALSAPADGPESAALYERDLTAPNLRADGLSTTACPNSLTATDDGILFAAAEDVDDRIEITTRYLLRSDDNAASWTKIALPQDLKQVTLEAGDGVVFVMGATPAENTGPIYAWHLYSLDVETGEFKHLRSYDAMDGDEITTAGALAYVDGSLYVIDCAAPGAGSEEPSHMRIRKLDADYIPGEDFLLEHEYPESGLAGNAPKVSAAGRSIYVCGLARSPIPGGDDYSNGLERVDVETDGSYSCTDLSSALGGLEGDTDTMRICMAADDDALYLIGSGLNVLRPTGSPYTDTFILKKGSTVFTPYSRTLSLGPIYYPVAVCMDGWLYAFADSKYEPTPVFGRSTNVRGSGPEPDPRPSPNSKEHPSASPKTGDSLRMWTTLLAIAAAIAALSMIASLAAFSGRSETMRQSEQQRTAKRPLPRHPRTHTKAGR